MGDIVRFVLRSDRIGRRSAAEAGVRPPCDIIILPCVRYERSDGDAPKPRPQRRKGRKRRMRAR